jgi:hypothetical protein
MKKKPEPSVFDRYKLPIYLYNTFIFEDHPYRGPVKLHKDLTPARAMGPWFYKNYVQWLRLPEKEKLATQLQPQ